MDLLAQHYHEVFKYPDLMVIETLLNKAQGSLIDFGCATGRVLEIAQNQARTAIGIDNSTAMIQIGRKRLSHRNNISFIEADFLEPRAELVGQAGLVTIMANTFSMLLSPEERLKALHVAQSYLNRSGRILLHVRGDVPSPDSGRELRVLTEGKKDLEFAIRWQEDRLKSLRYFYLDFKLDEQTERHTFITKIHTVESLEHDFKASDLLIEAQFNDHNQGQFSTEVPDWFFVLRKKLS